MAASDLAAIRAAAALQVGFTACRSKLAEVVEKAIKGELIRLGWRLERTHDLERLLDLLLAYRSDLVTVYEPLCEALADAYFSDRYPGFDLDDPDWPLLNSRLEAAAKLVETVNSRANPNPPPMPPAH